MIVGKGQDQETLSALSVKYEITCNFLQIQKSERESLNKLNKYDRNKQLSMNVFIQRCVRCVTFFSLVWKLDQIEFGLLRWSDFRQSHIKTEKSFSLSTKYLYAIVQAKKLISHDKFRMTRLELRELCSDLNRHFLIPLRFSLLTMTDFPFLMSFFTLFFTSKMQIITPWMCDTMNSVVWIVNSTLQTMVLFVII